MDSVVFPARLWYAIFSTSAPLDANPLLDRMWLESATACHASDAITRTGPLISYDVCIIYCALLLSNLLYIFRAARANALILGLLLPVVDNLPCCFKSLVAPMPHRMPSFMVTSVLIS